MQHNNPLGPFAPVMMRADNPARQWTPSPSHAPKGGPSSGSSPRAFAPETNQGALRPPGFILDRIILPAFLPKGV